VPRVAFTVTFIGSTFIVTFIDIMIDEPKAEPDVKDCSDRTVPAGPRATSLLLRKRQCSPGLLA